MFQKVLDLIKRTIGIKKAAIGLGYIVFMLLFWVIGEPHNMNPWVALIAILLITGIYYVLVKFVEKILGV